MAARLIRKSWWVDFRFAHRRYRKRSPENTRAGAQTYEASLRQRLTRGEQIENIAPEQEQTFEEFARVWFKEYVVPNNKYSEQRAKNYVLSASLIPVFGKTKVRQVTSHQVDRYKAQLVASGLSNKTVNNHLTILSKCLKTAYEWFVFEGHPPTIKRLKCVSGRTDYLSTDECRMLITHADGMLRDLILTALRTGMRQGELRGLQWSSVDWETRRLIVRHSRCDYRNILDTPKSNRERSIPLDNDLYVLLLKRRKSDGYVFTDAQGRPFNHHRLCTLLARVCEKSGLRRISWHVLRHTFASHLAMKGVPLNIVQTLLGHTSITTTLRYAHVAPSTLRTAIDLLKPAGQYPDLGQPVGNQWLDLQRKAAA